MPDALRDLERAYDGPIPRHEYDAIRYGRALAEDDYLGHEARAAEEEASARKCAELIVHYGKEEFSDARERVLGRLARDAERHTLNALGYRRIAASIRRRIERQQFRQAAE